MKTEHIADKELVQHLTTLVNSSGFQFQMAIEGIARSVGRWDVLATEYAWKHPTRARDGFVDAILEDTREFIRLVIECKRTRDAKWVFLQPRDSDFIDVSWTAVNDEHHASGTERLVFDPPSPQSQFCIVRGSNDDQRPMLERIASTLIEATDAIADEQFILDVSNKPTTSGGSHTWLYVPVIITNADLFVCKFNPADVSCETGDLPPDAEFVAVNFVRFYKNLTTDVSPGLDPIRWTV